MTLIGTNNAQIETYANEAEGNLGAIKTALDNLVAACVGVNYWGENAKMFKTKTATAAVTMGEEIAAAMTTFLTNVNAATSAIAGSLGGPATEVNVTVPTYELPTIPEAEVGKQGLDTEALNLLQESVNAQRDALNSAVEEHEAALGRTTEWVGSSKEGAVSACTTFTTDVTTAVTTNITKITTAISEQNAATIGADTN